MNSYLNSLKKDSNHHKLLALGFAAGSAAILALSEYAIPETAQTVGHLLAMMDAISNNPSSVALMVEQINPINVALSELKDNGNSIIESGRSLENMFPKIKACLAGIFTAKVISLTPAAIAGIFTVHHVSEVIEINKNIEREREKSLTQVIGFIENADMDTLEGHRALSGLIYNGDLYASLSISDQPREQNKIARMFVDSPQELFDHVCHKLSDEIKISQERKYDLSMDGIN